MPSTGSIHVSPNFKWHCLSSCVWLPTRPTASSIHSVLDILPFLTQRYNIHHSWLYHGSIPLSRPNAHSYYHHKPAEFVCICIVRVWLHKMEEEWVKLTKNYGRNAESITLHIVGWEEFVFLSLPFLKNSCIMPLPGQPGTTSQNCPWWDTESCITVEW